MRKINILCCFLVCVCAQLPFKAAAKPSSALARLQTALKHSRAKNYTQSTKQLFLLAKNPQLTKQRPKILYQLASDLYNMGLSYPAVFYWRALVKEKTKNYTAKSLQKIALAAARLGDDRLIQYTAAHNSLKYMPRSQRHKLYYHFGEFYLRQKKFQSAMAYFARVKSSSPFFYKALYQIGLAHAELNQAEKAAQVFDNLQNRRAGVTDTLRTAALMGKARAYYQAKKWKLSVENYLKVPKDSPFWYDTLLERSWALLRGGRLRSALSNFQTLHSSYYTNRYQPESLLLRAIVYLYICKYYEMEKVLDLFNKTYRPVYARVKNLVKGSFSFRSHYQSLLLSVDKKSRGRAYVSYPKAAARRILREGDVSALHGYITKLKEARDRMYSLPYSWRKSPVGRQAVRLSKIALKRAQKRAGRAAFVHLQKLRAELKDFFVQEQYIRYEMLRSKRGFLKKKIARKNLRNVSIEDFGRSYYVQNGYEYWPFKGEYWLDELGNYHYVGMGSCSK